MELVLIYTDTLTGEPSEHDAGEGELMESDVLNALRQCDGGEHTMQYFAVADGGGAFVAKSEDGTLLAGIAFLK